MRAVCLFAILLTAATSWAAPKQSRPQVSLDGRYTVRFEQDGSKCRLQVTEESGPVWAVEKCVATADDLFFVSGDGQRVWVLYPLGTLPKRGGQKALRKVKVAALFDRAGKTLKVVRLGDLYRPGKWVEVREVGSYFKWAEGTLGLVGKPPRLKTANSLELETLERRTMTLKF